jgi:hypothetical protein
MTTATMATPAKTKIENVSLRTFLEKNGIGGRLGNGLVMDPTHLNIIPGFNTVPLAWVRLTGNSRKLRTTWRVWRSNMPIALWKWPLWLSRFVMARLSFVRDTAVTVQFHWLIKFAKNVEKAR